MKKLPTTGVVSDETKTSTGGYARLGDAEMRIEETWTEDNYDEIWAEIAEEENKFHRECKRWNDRLIRVLTKVKGAGWVNDLLHFAKADAPVNGKWRIVRKPSGKKQSENYDYFTKVWVDQYCFQEDSYYGTVAVKIKKGRWLEMDFAC